MGDVPSPPSSNGLHRVDEPSVLQTFAQQGDTVCGPCAAARLGESSSNPRAAAPAADETRNLLILIASSFGRIGPVSAQEARCSTIPSPRVLLGEPLRFRQPSCLRSRENALVK